jgi:hypothetical protein
MPGRRWGHGLPGRRRISGSPGRPARPRRRSALLTAATGTSAWPGRRATAGRSVRSRWWRLPSRAGCPGCAAATCRGGTPPPSRCRRPAARCGHGRPGRADGRRPLWCRAARIPPTLLRSVPAVRRLPWPPGPAGSAAPAQGAAALGAHPRGIAARTGFPAEDGREDSAGQSIHTRGRDRRGQQRTGPLPAGRRAASSCGGYGRTPRFAPPTGHSRRPGRCPVAARGARSPGPAARY